MYSDIKEKLINLGYEDYGKYIKLIEAFSELIKRIECTYEALTSIMALEITINTEKKNNKNTDDLNNVKWIYLSYSYTELNNIIDGGACGLTKVYKNINNSTKDNKFPSYLGVNINIEVIQENESKFIALKQEFAEDIRKIRSARDRMFSHIDQKQENLFVSTKTMITILNKINNIFIDLAGILELQAVKPLKYTPKEDPQKFNLDSTLSKNRFFISYIYRDSPINEPLIEKTIKLITPILSDILEVIDDK